MWFKSLSRLSFILLTFSVPGTAWTQSPVEMPVPAVEPNTHRLDTDGFSDLSLYDGARGLFIERLTAANLAFIDHNTNQPGAVAASADFSGDGVVDSATFDRGNARWRILFSNLAPSAVTFGEPGELPVPGKYTNDNGADLATYDRATGNWRIGARLTGNTAQTFQLGGPLHIPVPCDYDGDGYHDPAVWNRMTGVWTIRYSNRYTPEQWQVLIDRRIPPFLNNIQWGLPRDIPLPADYNGDGYCDPAVWRPTDGMWYARGTYPLAPPVAPEQWGLPGDWPNPGRYAGGATTDLGVFRPSKNAMYIKVRPAGFAFYDILFPIFDQFLGGVEPPGSAEFCLVFPQLCNSTVICQEFPDFCAAGGAVAVEYERVGTPPMGYMPYYKRRGDLNGNGTSDITFIGTVNEVREYTSVDPAFTTTTGTSTFFFTELLGAQNETILSADVEGSGAAKVQVVKEESPFLTWNTLISDTQSESTLFGLVGDTPVVGDYNGDGVGDRAVVRNQGGFLYWYFLLSTGEEVYNFQWGLLGDTVHNGGDLDGNGRDDIIVSRDVGAYTYWYAIDLNDPSTFQAIQWGLSTDKKHVPRFDFNGDGFADIVVSRTQGLFNYFYVLHTGAAGSYEVLPFGLQGDVPFVGHFSGIPTAEVGVYRPSENKVYYRYWNGGMIVKQVELGLAPNTVLLPSGKQVSVSDAAGNPTGVQCTYSLSFEDGSEGALWKPISDNTGNPVILMPASYWTTTDAIEVYGSNGQKLLDGRRRTCCPNGGRAHFDIPRFCADLQPSPLTVVFKLSGGINECRSVPSPCTRFD